MTPEQYAQEFIDELPEILAELKESTRFMFCKNTLQNDPELKILRRELNKLNYDLIPVENDDWQLIKITK